MPKKDTGYTPSRSQSNPTDKQTVPFKSPGMKSTGLPQSISTPHMIANMSKPPSVTTPRVKTGYESYAKKPVT